MNHKTKIITSAATAFGLAIGTAGILGYRNIDDQWQALEKNQTEFSETKQQAELDIKERASTLLEREKIAALKLEDSENLVVKAQDIEQKSQQEMINAKQLAVEAKKARQLAITQQESATNLAERAKQKHSIADAREREFLNARAKTEAELTKSRKLQARLDSEIKITKYAAAKAKKAESTTVWYQNKAKKLIEQAECDIADASNRSREADLLHGKAKRVFHQINNLECELEDKCDELEDLEDKNDDLICQIKALASKHRKELDDKLSHLKRQNSDLCTTINKQKSIATLLKRDLEKADRENDQQKSLISKQAQEIKKLEYELRKKK